MYISRVYCKEKDKGYINDYEKRETQSITIHAGDDRDIPFKVYATCGDEFNGNVYNTVFNRSANSISTNYFTPVTNYTANYSITQGDTIIDYGTVYISNNGILYVPIEDDMVKGYYDIAITLNIGTHTYTRTYPLIST